MANLVLKTKIVTIEVADCLDKDNELILILNSEKHFWLNPESVAALAIHLMVLCKNNTVLNKALLKETKR